MKELKAKEENTGNPGKLRTLKDLQDGYLSEDGELISKKTLKFEAVKWYHRSDGDKHKFIRIFFNLTEENLK